MTIASTASEITYAGNGVTLAFAIPFVFDTDADIAVVFTDSSGNVSPQSTGFTITGGAGSTGTCTFLVAPPVGTTVKIYDDPEITQPVDYVANDSFPAETHEDALDRGVRISKRLSQQLANTLRFADGDPSAGALAQLGTVGARAGKVLAFNASSGAPEFAVSVTNYGTLTASVIGGLLYPQTTTESAASSTPLNLAKTAIPMDAGRYNAVFTGTDQTTQLQAAINALNGGALGGGEVVFPGDANSSALISNTLSIPKRVSGNNHSKWIRLRGNGNGSGQLVATTGMANKAMIDASGNSTGPVYSYYREFKDLYLNCAGIAQGGLDIRYNQHFRLERLFITAMEDGSGTGFGVRIFGAICAEIVGCRVHDGEGHGFWADGGSGNFTNACDFRGSIALNVTGSGFKITGGFSGNSCSGNTAEACDEFGLDIAGYSGTVGSISGWYFELNGMGDIRLGSDTQCNALEITGIYSNGYSAGISLTNYTPIWVKFADGPSIKNVMVAQAVKSPTGFYILDANIAGGSVANMWVENCQVRGIAASTPPNQLYNLPGTWCDFNNTLIDPLFAPFTGNDLERGRLPYGGWTLSPGGAGTVVRGPDIAGGPGVRLSRPAGGDAAVMSKVYTLPYEFKNRFVTIAVPVRDTVGSKSVTIACVPNGTAPQSTTIDVNTLAANAERIAYALVFIPANATTLTVTITANSSGCISDIGKPCIYVGARQYYSSLCDQDWRNDAAPTTGTWADGDKVYLNNAVSGAKMGFVCTVAGTPGTWNNMPNIA